MYLCAPFASKCSGIACLSINYNFKTETNVSKSIELQNTVCK